jgi:hypothetical protein
VIPRDCRADAEAKEGDILAIWKPNSRGLLSD